MAIMHISFKVGSRGNGQSASAKYDYICREGKYREKSNELLHKESGNMPEWAKDDSQPYWEAADTYERVNGRLFREVEFALPVELNSDQQIELSREFAREITDKENLPYTIAIHDKKDGNPHCHLVLSERKNDGIDRPIETWFKRPNQKEPECGGATKTRALIPKDWLTQTRERWADIGNDALERAGYDRELDPRTLKDQGIDRPPGIHLGPHVFEMEEKGILTERGKMALERESLVEQSIELTKEIERYTYERDRTHEEISPARRAGERGITIGREHGDIGRAHGAGNEGVAGISKGSERGLADAEYGKPTSNGSTANRTRTNEDSSLDRARDRSSSHFSFVRVLEIGGQFARKVGGTSKIREKLEPVLGKIQQYLGFRQGRDRSCAGLESEKIRERENHKREMKQLDQAIKQKQQREKESRLLEWRRTQERQRSGPARTLTRERGGMGR